MLSVHTAEIPLLRVRSRRQMGIAAAAFGGVLFSMYRESDDERLHPPESPVFVVGRLTVTQSSITLTDAIGEERLDEAGWPLARGYTPAPEIDWV